MSAGLRLANGVFAILVLLICAFMVAPTLAIVPISFTETDFITFPPHGFSWRWYAALLDAEWLRPALTSLVVGVAASCLATAIGTPAALGLYRLRRVAARFAFLAILLPLLVPSIITAVALYGVFASIGLLGTIPGLVLAHTLLALPFVVLNVSAVLQKMDWRIVDAARSLGASPVLAFRLVTLPSIWPGMRVGMLFAFLTSFDEIVVALFVSGAGSVTLPVRMWQGIRFEVSPAIAAASCVLLAVSLLLLAVFWLQKGK
jgi:ABC-type spermidine/putrescine transport system permease subunit II